MNSSPLCARWALCLALMAAAISQPVTAASAPEACRAIANDAERLACYDALFAPLPDPADTSATQQEQQRLEPLTRSNPQAAEEVTQSRLRRFRYSLFDENFAIQPHRHSFLLPYTQTNRINHEPFNGSNEGEDLTGNDLDNREVKFQISFKIPLAQDVLLKDATLWAAYTQQSLWQMYNNDASSPFRETNYEPELIWQVPIGRELGPVRLDTLSLGINHQSNGRGGDLSRSWNRIVAEANFSHNRWRFDLRPWYRIPEDEEDDDNPDIDDYLGYGDLTVSYEWQPDLQLSTKIRNNFHSHDKKTSFSLGLIFPLPGPLNGYLEYVNGYGESLIDYNFRSERIGIGVILNQWQ